VIGNQVVLADATFNGAVLNYDQWDGYPIERNRIVNSLDPSKNTVVLTGDIHFAGAGMIRQGERGSGTAVAVELVTTSISSGGRIDPAVTEVVKAIPDIVDVELEHTEASQATLRVRDQGVGIASTELKRIFKRFYRFQTRRDSKVKGTGLGLYIVRSIAKQHGGRVFAHSEGEGKGATFTLELPA